MTALAEEPLRRTGEDDAAFARTEAHGAAFRAATQAEQRRLWGEMPATANAQRRIGGGLGW